MPVFSQDSDRASTAEAGGRTLVVGDIHGQADALEQVLERSGFDPSADRLISLGDVCDRGPASDRCIDRLLEIPRLVLVLGNHDEWARDWMRSGECDAGWAAHYGGGATLAAYARRSGLPPPESDDAAAAASLAERVPSSHLRLLEAAVDYHIETRPDGRRALFVHAGWNPRVAPEGQSARDLRWGRDLWYVARQREAAGWVPEGGSLTGFDVVCLGHTPTHDEWLAPRPVYELWNLDQGAGWDGALTAMDVDTGEWWQSDRVARGESADGAW